MNPALVLAAIAVAPVALALLFRSNAAIVFFVLCAGSVLEQHAGTATLLADSFPSHENNSVLVHLGLLLVPALVAMVLLRKSISAAKLPLNVVPAVALGLTTALLVVPILPGGLQANVVATEAWKQLSNYSDFIISVGVGASLVVLALTYKMPKEHRKHK